MLKAKIDMQDGIWNNAHGFIIRFLDKAISFLMESRFPIKRISDFRAPDRWWISTRIIHPTVSGKKGVCEKSHEYIRYFLPKGSSFADLDAP